VLSLVIMLFFLSSAVANVGLSNYPFLFVQNNEFVGQIVYGEDAGGTTTAAAFNLETSIRQYFEQQNAQLQQGSGSVTIDPGTVDSIQLAELELEEYLGDEEDVFKEEDLPALLPSGRFSTTIGTTEYEQYLRFEATDVRGGRVVFDEYEDILGDFYLNLDEENLFEWELKFERGAESRIDEDTKVLTQFIGEELNMLGTKYVILQAFIDEDDQEIDLDFLSADVDRLYVEGQPVTVIIDGQEYVIVAESVTDATERVVFSINGEFTDALKESEFHITDSGLLIGVNAILVNDAAEVPTGTGQGTIDLAALEGRSLEDIQGMLDQATAFITQGRDIVSATIGTHHIEFTDQYNDEEFTNNVHVNEELIDEGFVSLQGEVDGDRFTLNKIKYRPRADPVTGANAVYIKPGEGLRDQLDQADALLSPSWDIIFEGLNDVNTYEIHFDPRSKERYDLTFYNRDGELCEVPLIDNSDEGGLGFNLGDRDNDLFFIECASDTAYCIKEKDYFIVSDDDDYTGHTYVVQYSSIANDDKRITFKDICNDDTIEESYSGTPGANATGELTIGGKSFKFHVGPGDDDNLLTIDLDKDDEIEADEVRIVTKGGVLIDLGTTNEPSPPIDSSFIITMIVEAELFDGDGPLDAGGHEEVELEIVRLDNNEVGLVIGDQIALELQGSEDLDQEEWGKSFYGALYKYDEDDLDLKVDVPEEQVMGSVAVVKYPGGGVTVTGGGGTPIDLTDFIANPTVTDTQVISTTDMLIAVGNACDNSVIARLFNNPDPCDAGLQDGIGLLRLFHKGGNYQLVATGKTELDVKKATTALQNFQDYTLTSDLMEVRGSGASISVNTLDLATWQARFDADIGGPPVPPTDDDGPPTPVARQCSDGDDNDNDGFVDFPSDPGCSSSSDNDETDPAPDVAKQCNDGIDNDGDAFVDLDDPGCANADDDDEMDEVPPEMPDEEAGLGMLFWIIMGIVLIGGAGGAAYFYMKKKHKAPKVVEEPPIPQGYTKAQWTKTLEYYKKNYPDWYTKYMEWWKRSKAKGKGKDVVLIMMLIGVSLVGLSMIVTVSLQSAVPGAPSTTVAGAIDVAGEATAFLFVTCTHPAGAGFRMPAGLPTEMNEQLCLEAGPWSCESGGVTTTETCQQ